LSWTNKQLAKFFPTFALKREIVQRRLTRLEEFKPKKRSFEAISSSRLRYDFLTTSKAPDAAIRDGIEGLRNHVRQLEYNNGFVAGPIQRIVNYVVGRGFRLQSTVKADDNNYFFPKITEEDAERINFTSELAFKKWSKTSDSRLIQTFPEQCRTVEAALIRDGEVIAVGRNSDKKIRLIPYCLEIFEADRLQTPMDEINNPKVRNGIRFDDEGAPESYFLLKRHPGETITVTNTKTADFEELPAFNANGTRKVMHLYNPLRPEQTRGFSAFAAALKDFQDLDRYREAEIYAALEDACMTGMVTTENPTGWQGNATVASDDEKYDRIHEFAPGQWHYFRPGEKADIHSPKRPNDAFGEMTNQLLRGPANVLDIPPEVLSQNWQGMNYSNARTVLLFFYLSCWIRQNYLITHFCDPVHENVMIDFVVRGIVKALGFDRRKSDFLSHGWIPMVRREWVDPSREAKGKESDLRNSIETLPDVWAGKGEDWEEKLELQARALKRMKELEEKYGIQFPKNQGGKTSGAEPEGMEEGDIEEVVSGILKAVK